MDNMDSAPLTPSSDPADMPEDSGSATFRDWWQAARPHTWFNAVAPVVVGTGAAAYEFWWSLPLAFLALIVSMGLIIGVNYANDYSDGVRGTDDDRSGPARLTASGKTRPENVKRAAFISFGIAGLAGLVLALISEPWLILVGAVCILAAWFYTGGKNPYGYRGLGEVSVFIFFGLVAVLGTQFTQSLTVTWVGVACAVAVGAISAAINLANNIRDIPTDKEAGKVTLAVKLGDKRARILFSVLTLVPFVVTLILATTLLTTLLALVALPWAISSIMVVQRGAQGPDLIPVLGRNGSAMLVWSLVTAVALTAASPMWWVGETVPYTVDGNQDFGWTVYIDR